jgi:hypothetical protein
VHPVVRGRRQVVERRRHDDAVGAEADRVDLVGTGDLSRRVDPLEQGAGKGVQVPVGLLLGGVTPAQHEDLQALADGVLDVLRALGHDVHGWSPGTNRGSTGRVVRELRSQLDELPGARGGG